MLGNRREKVVEVEISSAKNVMQNKIRKNTNKEIAEIIAAVHTHTHTRCIVF